MFPVAFPSKSAVGTIPVTHPFNAESWMGHALLYIFSFFHVCLLSRYHVHRRCELALGVRYESKMMIRD